MHTILEHYCITKLTGYFLSVNLMCHHVFFFSRLRKEFVTNVTMVFHIIIGFAFFLSFFLYWDEVMYTNYNYTSRVKIRGHQSQCILPKIELASHKTTIFHIHQLRVIHRLNLLPPPAFVVSGTKTGGKMPVVLLGKKTTDCLSSIGW